jgi:preprotein translocase subunit SecB
MAENDTQETQPAAQGDANQPRFNVQRIFLKDSSFEAPDTPDCFRRSYTPQINFSINSRSKKVEDNVYEVVLRLTADVKQEDKTVFLVEVQQAGIFEVAGMEGDRLEQVLTITCPNILFPYGREAVDSLVTKGSFPALMLAPINFEAVYMQAKKNQSSQAQAAAAEAPIQ